MNISIVLPGGCNAKCKFCFAGEGFLGPVAKDWDKNLGEILEGCSHSKVIDTIISITGGEPTLSPKLDVLLDLIKPLRHYYKRVGLTTNGAKLEQLLDRRSDLAEIVDYLNISRHHWDPEKRKQIFGTEVISDEKLCEMFDRENCPRPSFAAVVTKDLYNDERFYEGFIRYCYRLGIDECHFRKDYSLSPWYVWPMADTFVERWPEGSFMGSCPVCKQLHHEVCGQKVVWKFATFDPTAIQADRGDWGDFIYKPDGVLYWDWNNKFPVDWKDEE